ncbi:hypothetical protein O181_029377 [Austropuccinia psidii MF-1]|uniref:SEC63 domain-containing protein n=1 Tax=Austropuccinia psidii MF-1 TaxID=1389203 RepID=A0A9Q3CWG4_9BASI|nr:hypothetical protein [Austropuccinia psidii MF-1]
MRQLDQIGEKSVKRLVESGIDTIEKLRNTSEHRIEMILDRNPPFGLKVIRQACSMPQLFCTIRPISEEVVTTGVQICVEISVGISESKQAPIWQWKNVPLMATVLVMTNDQQWIEFRTTQVKLLNETKYFTVECILVKPSQCIVTSVACTQIAGIGHSTRWKPMTPRENYPKPKAIASDEVSEVDVLKQEQPSQDLKGSETKPSGNIVTNRKFNSESLSPKINLSKYGDSFGASTKTKNLAFKKSVDRDPGSESREKLDNGRFKCSHRCKGPCAHNCCVYGVRKPTKAQASKESPAQSLRATKRPHQNKTEDTLPITPFRTTNITRTAEDLKMFDQMMSGGVIKAMKPEIKNKIRPIRARKIAGIDEERGHEELPCLSEEEQVIKKIQNEDDCLNLLKSPQISCNQRAGRSGIGDILDLDSLDEKSKGSDDEIDVAQTGDIKEPMQAHKLNGIEKFRNKLQGIQEFDEKRIFNERKNLLPTPPCKQTTPPYSPLEVLSESECTLPSVKVFAQTSQRSKSASEDEIDELDEEYDMRVFEGYLVEEPEQKFEAPPQPAKRRHSSSNKNHAAKCLKKTVTRKLEDPEACSHSASNDSSGAKLIKPRPAISRDLSDLDRQSSKPGRLFETERSPSLNTEGDDDPMMAIVDEVMAWAEANARD